MIKRLWPLWVLLTVAPLGAADLRQATFTQVIKEVTVVSSGTKSTTKAKLNDMFVNPDIVQTGPDSLAELIAEDKTVTRIGANTIFSFSAKGREVNLEQGSVLFHSPKGKGGGTIKTKAASASVLGTTIVVTATTGGGFKAIVLEGKGQITLPNGDFRILQAGQVTFVLPGSRQFGPQLNINLSKLVENSRLVQGFEQELPSKPVIQAEVERQLTLITTGKAVDTGSIIASGPVTSDTVTTTVLEQAVQNQVDPLALAKGRDVNIIPAAAGQMGAADLRDYPDQLFNEAVSFDIAALGGLKSAGLVGKTINVTPGVSQIDFTPFIDQPAFTIAAQESLNLQGASLVLSASAPGTLQKVTFAGKAGLTIAPSAFINAFHIGDVQFVTDGMMSLNNVSFCNSGGLLRLNAGQGLDLAGGGVTSTPSLTLEGGTVSVTGGSYSVSDSARVSAYGTELRTDGASFSGDIVSLEASTSSDLDNTTASATTLLNLNSQQDVHVDGGSYSVSGAGGTLQVSAGRDLNLVGGAQFTANTIQMTAANNATLNNVQARGFNTLNVTAAQNLNVASGSFTGAALSPTVAATFTAGDTLTVNGPTLSGVANISMSARTVSLSNIDFPNGSTVSLRSQFGQLAANPNTGAASVPGYVNFIVNVNYNGSPAQSFVGSRINIGVRP